MPRKTKEIVVLNNNEIKDEDVKKLAKKSSKIDSAKEEKRTVAKVSETQKKTEKRSNTTNIKTTKSAKTQKIKKTTSDKQKKAETNYLIEYYDLPYRYNQTVVKILAQTPNSLFVYWDISDSDRENYLQKYGEDFFYTTKPVLKIYNDTLNYNFEIDVDDFANGWYIRVNDADCIYRAELARRPKYYNSNVKENYIYVTSSNKIDSPNDHILFEKITPDFKFKFRNVKNNNINYKNISNILNGKNLLSTKIEQLYSNIYEKTNIEELYRHSNPSSNFSSRN